MVHWKQDVSPTSLQQYIRESHPRQPPSSIDLEVSVLIISETVVTQDSQMRDALKKFRVLVPVFLQETFRGVFKN